MTREGRLVALVVGLALLVRLARYEARPLWLDEAISVSVATSSTPWATMIAEDMHPPLFAVLARLVLATGAPLEAVRGVSLVASLVAVGLAVDAGRTWGGRKVGLVAGLLAASSNLWAVYAWEARPYALGMAALWGLFAAAGRRSLGGLAVAALVAVSSLHSAVPVVVLVAAWAVWRMGSALRSNVLVYASMTWIVFVATPQLSGQGRGLTDGFLSPYFWSFGDVVGFTLWRVPEVLGHVFKGGQGPIVVLFGLIVGLLAARGARRNPELGFLALAPAGMLWVLAGLGFHPFGPTRHMLVLAPGLTLLVAQAISLDRVVVAAFVLFLNVGPFRVVLPVSDPVTLVQALPDRRIAADASVAPVLAVYGEPVTVALPWRNGPVLTAQLAGHDVDCLVYASTREAEVADALSTFGRAADRFETEGAVAVCAP